MDLFNTKIFNFISHELGECKIVLIDNTIWFINTENKKWYIKLEDNGHLWWRWRVFNDLFSFMSMDVDTFEPYISKWVKNKLDGNTTYRISSIGSRVTIPIWEHNRLFSIT